MNGSQEQGVKKEHIKIPVVVPQDAIMSFVASNLDLQSAQVHDHPSLQKNKDNKNVPCLPFEPHITARWKWEGHEVLTSLKEFLTCVSILCFLVWQFYENLILG